MARITLAVVGIALAVFAIMGAVLRATSQRSVEVGNNTLVSAPALLDANNSPSLAQNPRRPQNLALSYRVDRLRFSAALAWTDDGGTTWQRTALPLPDGKDRPFGPDVAFGPDGTLYVTYVNLEGTGNVPANLWVSTSGDGGRTLSPPVLVAGRLTFQARMAVAPSGTVHVTWLQGSEVGLFKLTGSPNPIVSASSTDGARTFSPVVTVSDPERERVGAASPVIDSNGRLVVLYQDFKGDRRDFENLDGPPWDEPFSLVFTHSSDGGRSFAKGVEFESGMVPTRRFLVFLPVFPSLASASDGSLYAAWSDGRNGDEDVFIRRSGDGGRTWEPPVRVNENPMGDGTDQYLPRVAVSPSGRVDVVFFDRRQDPQNVMTDVTVAWSHDRGRSFDAHRVASQPFDSRVGPSLDPKFGVDFGSRLALVSGDGPSVAAWTDSRNGTVDTGRQDVLATTFEIPAPPGGLATIPVIAILLVLSVAAFAGSRLAGRSSLRGP
ncbi:MAG TPA: sialidase family protein [Acidimicrobiales bacterium]|nr:sialidase family protein [Acidimicrobiales bacterium]